MLETLTICLMNLIVIESKLNLSNIKLLRSVFFSIHQNFLILIDLISHRLPPETSQNVAYFLILIRYGLLKCKESWNLKEQRNWRRVSVQMHWGKTMIRFWIQSKIFATSRLYILRFLGLFRKNLINQVAKDQILFRSEQWSMQCRMYSNISRKWQWNNQEIYWLRLHRLRELLVSISYSRVLHSHLFMGLVALLWAATPHYQLLKLHTLWNSKIQYLRLIKNSRQTEDLCILWFWT